MPSQLQITVSRLFNRASELHGEVELDGDNVDPIEVRILAAQVREIAAEVLDLVPEVGSPPS
jgi:hypothetical protein